MAIALMKDSYELFWMDPLDRRLLSRALADPQHIFRCAPFFVLGRIYLLKSTLRISKNY